MEHPSSGSTTQPNRKEIWQGLYQEWAMKTWWATHKRATTMTKYNSRELPRITKFRDSQWKWGRGMKFIVVVVIVVKGCRASTWKSSGDALYNDTAVLTRQEYLLTNWQGGQALSYCLTAIKEVKQAVEISVDYGQGLKCWDLKRNFEHDSSQVFGLPRNWGGGTMGLYIAAWGSLCLQMVFSRFYFKMSLSPQGINPLTNVNMYVKWKYIIHESVEMLPFWRLRKMEI